MPGGFLDRLDFVLKQSDIVLEVLDARFPELTRNARTEYLVKQRNKKLILVVNKADLVSKRQAEKIKSELSQEYPVVFVSASLKNGSSFLRNIILKLANHQKASIAVVGYPNVGKSSLINMLSGRHSTKTSSTAGFTRGEQLVNISEQLSIWDSPGVIPYTERDSFKLVLIGSKNPNQIKDPEQMGLLFLQWMKQHHIESLTDWGLDAQKDEEELLEDFARQKNKLKKGGLPDTKTASVQLLQLWQCGKLRL